VEKMLATSSRIQAGRGAGERHINSVPYIICVVVVGMVVSAAINIAIAETDVLTPVFLCALQLLVVLLLLGFLALLSLTLTGLTGLAELKSLVGLSLEPAINTA